MNRINKFLEKIKPYKVASHKIWRTPLSKRSDMLKLDWNEATCETSPLVKDRLQHLLQTQFLNLYPDTSNQELYDSLSQYTDLPVRNIQYFGSSDAIHEYISRIYLTSGDEILILWPSYDNLRLTLQVSGANLNFFELKEDFSFNTQEFESKIDLVRPKLVYICNPNNPTGTLLDKSYIKYLIERYSETIFLIDEAYIEFCEGNSCKELVLDHDNILITRTLSKAFGLANVRFGYLLASKENIEAVSKIRNPKNITSFAQEAAIGVLSDISFMKAYVEEVHKAKEYFIKTINQKFKTKLKACESNGNFVLINCHDYETKCGLLEFLEENNIFIRAVSQTESLRNYVRVTIGTKEQMKRVIEKIEEFFK